MLLETMVDFSSFAINFDVCLNSVTIDGSNILGGCATVAGWGKRYSHFMDYHANGTKLRQKNNCMTDFSSFSPDKLQ